MGEKIKKFWNVIKRPLLIVLFWYLYWVLTGHMSNAFLLVAILIYMEIFIRRPIKQKLS